MCMYLTSIYINVWKKVHENSGFFGCLWIWVNFFFLFYILMNCLFCFTINRHYSLITERTNHFHLKMHTVGNYDLSSLKILSVRGYSILNRVLQPSRGSPVAESSQSRIYSSPRDLSVMSPSPSQQLYSLLYPHTSAEREFLQVVLSFIKKKIERDLRRLTHHKCCLVF